MYAHVATEHGEPGIAVQYWYNYYFNDFANKHEGDWEMVQVMFDDANSAEEALQQEPTRTAYSGHAGGELADWTDKKLEKLGDRPSSTSRPAQTPPTTRRARSSASPRRAGVRLRPDDGPAPQGGPGARAAAGRAADAGRVRLAHLRRPLGRGVRLALLGIAGPAVRERWYEPFTWANDLRDFSDKIPDSVLGIDPVGAICAIVNTGSDIMLFYGEHPWVVIGGALIVLGGLGAVSSTARRNG